VDGEVVRSFEETDEEEDVYGMVEELNGRLGCSGVGVVVTNFKHQDVFMLLISDAMMESYEALLERS